MKKNLLLWSMVMSSLISFTSCTDDENFKEPEQPTLDGTDIQIGASAGYEPLSRSRTIYPGKVAGGVEKINWILGDEYNDLNSGKGGWVADEIRVLSLEALEPIEGQPYADYKVIAHSETNPKITTHLFDGTGNFVGGGNSSQGLQPTGDGTDIAKFTVTGNPPMGLKWNPDRLNEHYFYAVYPSPALNRTVKLYKEQETGNVVFEGTLSSSQSTVGYIEDPDKDLKEKNIISHIALPVMRQNYMWAIHKADETEVMNNAIGLKFKTIATALEVDLVCPDGLKEGIQLSEVRLTYKGTDQSLDLAGNFKVNMTEVKDQQTETTTMYPNFTPIQTTTSQKSLTVNLDADDKDEYVGVTIKPGNHLKVRFLMLPHKGKTGQGLDGHDLKLTIRGPFGERSHLLANTAGKFYLAPHKLNRIKNIQIPGNLRGSNWISQLDDNILLSQLSIPGTGSSYLHTNTTDPKTYAQIKTVPEQWEMGIRCFDITVGRLGDEPNDSQNWGNNHLRIDNNNDHNLTTTVNDAFTTLLTQVKETNKDKEAWNGEFGMLIIRYQPGSQNRGAQEFVDNFETYFEALDKTEKLNDYIDPNIEARSRFCLFKPGITVKDARGKIMVILYPTSEGEDFVKPTTRFQNYLMVHGNGSLPDKFYRRGYFYKKNGQSEARVSLKCPVNLDINGKLQSAEHYIVNPSDGSIYRKESAVDFSYETNQTFPAYVQDWLRVIDDVEGATESTTVTFNANNGKNVYYNYQWNTSYSEKLSNVTSTFNKAVLDKDNTSQVYINSLCGILVNEANRGLGDGQYVPLYNSWPAVAGNIKALADKLNPAFYQHMYNVIRNDGAKGPMGVVLMNFVGDPNVPGSTLMPNLVISNNFSFPLRTGTPGQNTDPDRPNPNPNPDTPTDDLMPDADGSYDAGGWLWGK